MNVSFEEHLAFKLNEPMQFLVFLASLRDGSLNSRLASLAGQFIERHGGKVELL